MLVELMGCMGAFLTLVDIHEYFTDEKVEIGLFRLFIGCAILVLFVNFVWKTLVFQCKFHGNRIIKIRFGNILKRKDGTVLVPINDRLYSRRNIGRRNTGSMHDQLMDGRYGDAIAMALSKEAQCVGASNGKHAPHGPSFQRQNQGRKI